MFQYVEQPHNHTILYNDKLASLYNSQLKKLMRQLVPPTDNTSIDILIFRIDSNFVTHAYFTSTLIRHSKRQVDFYTLNTMLGTKVGADI